MGLVFRSAGGAAETPVERGAYLVNGIAGCGNCHSPKGPDGLPTGPELIGGPAILDPGFEAYPPNLTSAPKTGLGRWTPDDIVAALREGRTPEGIILRPPMPIAFYRNMLDSDAQAIAAYLKSVPAVENQVPEARYKVPPPTGYGPPVASVPAVRREDKVAYGAYLGQLGHCVLCHTPIGANGQRDYANHLGAGGLELNSAGGSVISANITPDKATGIGGWTDREIKTALTTGIRPNGAQLAAPMPWYYFKNMTDADVDAIIAWLRSLKPIAYVAR
jgi:mono/diheme cytochrome c family protein